MNPYRKRAIRGAALLALWPMVALADGVSVRYDADASPFPSNRYTVPDFGNATLRRVQLPKSDCAARPSDCADIDVINTGNEELPYTILIVAGFSGQVLAPELVSKLSGFQSCYLNPHTRIRAGVVRPFVCLN